MGKKGSIWLKPDLFYSLLTNICGTLKEQGFKRVILVLAHGGIFVAGPAVREINATMGDFKAISVDLVHFYQSAEVMSILESRNNLHACEIETSLMLYLKEDLVRIDRIEDSLPDVPRDFLNYNSIFKYSSNGVWGSPSLATREKGMNIFTILIEESMKYIHKVNSLFI